MRDPYLYEDADVLRNLAEIKDAKLLHKAESDITNLTMTAIYNMKFSTFTTSTLQEIHRLIFLQIYDWAGDFRTIQMIKYEDVLGGDSVHYATLKEIKKQVTASIKELSKVKRNGENDHDIIFRFVELLHRYGRFTHSVRVIHVV